MHRLIMAAMVGLRCLMVGTCSCYHLQSKPRHQSPVIATSQAPSPTENVRWKHLPQHRSYLLEFYFGIGDDGAPEEKQRQLQRLGQLLGALGVDVEAETAARQGGEDAPPAAAAAADGAADGQEEGEVRGVCSLAACLQQHALCQDVCLKIE
jgi:hypothetical protein